MSNIIAMEQQVAQLASKRKEMESAAFSLQIQSESLEQKQKDLEFKLLHLKKTQPTSFNPTISGFNNNTLKNSGTSKVAQQQQPYYSPSMDNNTQFIQNSTQGMYLDDSIYAESVFNDDLSHPNCRDNNINLNNQNILDFQSFQDQMPDQQNQFYDDDELFPESNIDISAIQTPQQIASTMNRNTSRTKSTKKAVRENIPPSCTVELSDLLVNKEVYKAECSKKLQQVKIMEKQQVETNKQMKKMKTLEIFEDDDPQTVQRKQYLEMRYQAFKKLFKKIQPSYMQDSGYCRYPESIRKTFAFFMNFVTNHRIQRDYGLRSGTLNAWQTRYADVDESILDVKDYNYEFTKY